MSFVMQCDGLIWTNDEGDTAPNGDPAQDGTGDKQQGVEASTPDEPNDTAVAEALLEELENAVDED